jgi:hypothetical protein
MTIEDIATKYGFTHCFNDTSFILNGDIKIVETNNIDEYKMLALLLIMLDMADRIYRLPFKSKGVSATHFDSMLNMAIHRIKNKFVDYSSFIKDEVIYRSTVSLAQTLLDFIWHSDSSITCFSDFYTPTERGNNLISDLIEYFNLEAEYAKKLLSSKNDFSNYILLEKASSFNKDYNKLYRDNFTHSLIEISDDGVNAIEDL